MRKCQYVLDKDGEAFSVPSQRGVAKRGGVGPQNILYWKHSSHALAESAQQKYEKEIKDVFMQHSRRELTSHLKVLCCRVLHPERSTKTSLCMWQGWCEGGSAEFWMKQKERTGVKTPINAAVRFLPHILCLTNPNGVLDDTCTYLCVCLHNCWRCHSFSFCVCTARYWRPWGWSSKQLLCLL